jgi:tetratricopeptide (TPR) repeat protein
MNPGQQDFDLGVAAAQRGDMPGAKEHFAAAISHAEQSFQTIPTSGAATLLARYLVAAGRHDDVLEMFARDKTGSAVRYDVLMGYGQIFTQLGQRENALAAYHAAAARRPFAVTANTVTGASWVKDCPFTAAQPSPRYGELIAQYEHMHAAAQADARTRGAKTFEGFVAFSITAPYVQRFARDIGAISLLDYGGGRGTQYDLGAIKADGQTFADPKAYLGVDRVQCFDPGIARDVPTEMFDLVICIDALEHCDRQDLPWIVGQLFEKARKGVFANIAAYAAAKTLPNGENAHCTIEGAPWWAELFSAVAADFPGIAYQVIVTQDLRQTNRSVFGRAAR